MLTGFQSIGGVKYYLSGSGAMVSGWQYLYGDWYYFNSSGAMESGVRVYILVENSTELFPQVSFKYDGYTNKKNPWFLSYSSEVNEDKWENVSKETYNERKKVFDKYERFDFIPLNSAVK